MAEAASRKSVLAIRDLHVHYGESHAIQGVDLALPHRILSIVGRNGMGKSTLCNTVVGLKRATAGSIAFLGREISGLETHEIARLGVRFVPQGRRVWPSLSVDEHLRLASRGGREAAWPVDRIYATFPLLAERRANGGGQLSGGEQQMLAISRALVGNPRLLVMDEPTEGLAPRIVDQVAAMLVALADEGDIAVLLIEQNIGVATSVAEDVAIMVNGRIERILPAAQLAADRALQQRLLGVGRHGGEAEPDSPRPGDAAGRPGGEVLRIVRAGDRPGGAGAASAWRATAARANRWSLSDAELGRGVRALPPAAPAAATDGAEISIFQRGGADRAGRTVLVVGTFDTKGRELMFLRDALRAVGVRTRTVDLSTSGRHSIADVPPQDVAGSHPAGSSAVFSGDRGRSVEAMAAAFERWILRRNDIAGVISAGGSGGTTLATAGMRRLPVGIPKLMISTVASGEVGSYVGAADILMMYSVADIQGLNAITETVLKNGAHALAGMVAARTGAAGSAATVASRRPALGITMFGVTTPCVQALQAALGDSHDCLVFHATGTGGRAMEALADAGLLAGALDVTTTEVADLLAGGVFPATEDRFGAFIRREIPYVGSTGALDMVNFGPRDTVPERFAGRRFVVHNPNVTLMRTTREENAAAGRWIGERLNRMRGPVRFLLPEGGVSSLDAPGQPFHDPAADAALFEAIEATVQTSGRRRVIRVPANINDAAFVAAAVGAFRTIAAPAARRA
jgi:uncharacterized protein (UPF0261 family)/ABC-type branched-subunit amino acid transport system ATPase component